jgi:hypothetical protein
MLSHFHLYLSSICLNTLTSFLKMFAFLSRDRTVRNLFLRWLHCLYPNAPDLLPSACQKRS